MMSANCARPLSLFQCSTMQESYDVHSHDLLLKPKASISQGSCLHLEPTCCFHI